MLGSRRISFLFFVAVPALSVYKCPLEGTGQALSVSRIILSFRHYDTLSDRNSLKRESFCWFTVSEVFALSLLALCFGDCGKVESVMVGTCREGTDLFTVARKERERKCQGSQYLLQGHRQWPNPLPLGSSSKHSPYPPTSATVLDRAFGTQTLGELKIQIPT